MNINKKGNIEILLLLGCLAGVVAFFALSMAMTATIPDTNSTSIGQDLRDLLKEKDAKEHLLEKLKKDCVEFEQKIKELEKSVALQRKIFKGQRKILEKKLVALKEQDAKLKAEISRRGKELSRLKYLPQTKDRDKLRLELKRLKDKQREVEAKINQILMSTSSIKEKEQESDLEETKIRLERERHSLEGKKEAIKKEISRLKVRLLTGGSHHYKNPVYVDCQRGSVVFYPSAETVSSDSISEESLSEIIAGRDVVVIFVRPEGFDTFEAIRDKLQDKNIPICYEPLMDNVDLSYLAKKEQKNER